MAAAPDIALPAAVLALFPESLRERLVELRRALHRHPELSSAEHRTAERLRGALAELMPRALAAVAGTGVLARIAGRDPAAPAVAIRGDIDALPIAEETGLEYASLNAGVMHACGHDVHAAWTVGAAALLALRPAAGDVVIVLQPAEETGRGALAMIEAGALEGVAAIFGGHVDRRFAVGEVVADEGPVAAASDGFEIELTGRGSHAARPHEGRDPVVGAAALITALQTIVSRRLNPATPAVVSVGVVQAGTAPNVIPERATLRGTLRAVDGATRQALHEELRRVAAGVAAAHNLTAEVRIDHGTPPLVNPAEPIRWARRAVAGLLGESALRPLGTVNLGGEDFAHYLERLPGCFLRIGAREAGGEPIPAHTSRFQVAEAAIFVGAAVLAETARAASDSLAP